MDVEKLGELTGSNVAELPKATLRGGAPWRPRPRHVIAAFAVLSLIPIARTLLAYTLWFPPIGLALDAAWFGPLALVVLRKRMTAVIGVLCLVGFVAQAVVFDVPEAVMRVADLEIHNLVTMFAIVGGLVASIVAIAKPDPDPDFVPNEFTIR